MIALEVGREDCKRRAGNVRVLSDFLEVTNFESAETIADVIEIATEIISVALCRPGQDRAIRIGVRQQPNASDKSVSFVWIH